MIFYYSKLTESFIDYFYFDLRAASKTLKEHLALRYTNFLCGTEMFESFKYLFSQYPKSILGPEIDLFVITYAGSKFILSEKLESQDIIPFSKMDVTTLRMLL
jgi:hypothetical protein